MPVNNIMIMNMNKMANFSFGKPFTGTYTPLKRLT